jgi:hypothetical protein
MMLASKKFSKKGKTATRVKIKSILDYFLGAFSVIIKTASYWCKRKEKTL